MYTLQTFLDSDLSLIIFEEDRELFKSQASDLEPLVQFLQKRPRHPGRVTVFDRYVGRAAALLISRLSPVKVNTGVISDGGREVLTDAGIDFEARERAKYLMGVASEDMCRWEKLAMGKNSEELLEQLLKTREK